MRSRHRRPINITIIKEQKKCRHFGTRCIVKANYSLSSIQQNLSHTAVSFLPFTTICTTTFLLFCHRQQHHNHIVLPPAPLSQSCLNCFTTNTATTFIFFHHHHHQHDHISVVLPRLPPPSFSLHDYRYPPPPPLPNFYLSLHTTHGHGIYRTDYLRRTLAFILSQKRQRNYEIKLN